jgi:tRNA A37 threonylcarbamoyltransferase TsaD
VVQDSHGNEIPEAAQTGGIDPESVSLQHTKQHGKRHALDYLLSHGGVADSSHLHSTLQDVSRPTFNAAPAVAGSTDNPNALITQILSLCKA